MIFNGSDRIIIHLNRVMTRVMITKQVSNRQPTDFHVMFSP